MTTTDEERRGRKLLADLLPWARAEVRKGDGQVELLSGLSKAMAGHVREDNLKAVMIYPAPKGGWHADVTFKDMPPGLPNAMGSPVGTPLATRAQAEAMAKRLLVGILTIAAQALPPGDAVFHLHDTLFRFPQAMYEAALLAAPRGAGGPRGGYASRERAIERIEAQLAAALPGGWSKDAYDRLPTDIRANLASVLFIATLTGLWHYPPRQDGTPSGHTDVSQGVH